jgi:hypothetical protein
MFFDCICVLLTRARVALWMQVGEIQNPGLGEFKIRDLNDEINKLIREKAHWEKRIIELGGPNYLVRAKHLSTQNHVYGLWSMLSWTSPTACIRGQTCCGAPQT